MPLVQRFKANQVGRDFVVGDIHGWLKPLWAELEAVGFDPAVDRLFAVGDLIDRGPHSVECLMLTREPWFHSTRGNHEQFLFDWLSDPAGCNVEVWLCNGGRAWLGDDPQGFFQQNPQVAGYVRELANEMPWVIELTLADGRRLGISHSSLPVDDWLELEVRLQHDQALRHAIIWDRPIHSPGYDRRIKGIDLTVHGHVIVPQVIQRGNGVYIDTGAALLGQGAAMASHISQPRLTLVEVASLFEMPQCAR